MNDALMDVPEQDLEDPLFEAVIEDQFAGERIDKVLATMLPEFSRSRIQQAIAEKQVMLDGKLVSSKTKVFGGESIKVLDITNEMQTAFEPENIAIEVVAEDDDILVINKPVGMVVHPAAGNWSGTLLNALLYHYPQLGQVPRAGIVHRLDKDTSGLLVVAKNIAAQTQLIRQMQQHEVERLYLAVVWGEPKPMGLIDKPIGRDGRDRTRMAPLTLGGKPARTHYEQIAVGYYDHHQVELPITVVKCQLETGRTHQIRVHMASIGHPLLGDQTYQHLAPKARRMPLPMDWHRQALHAFRLSLRHPVTGERLEWQAPLPDDLQKLINVLGFDQEAILSDISPIQQGRF
ncbi:unnamed protein product [Darwinula stevensoni]|uniref:Pseudouridine synthase n=1 Tax=Darwinula stevensoni TaxID=69355 RepID=A0A7R9AHQ0_9CRUS|nr:unnamed protein product [Darwinula stevensoni]CAG0905241.1 unnamed protein product [Darwinula stevensoni]